jgi:hypothetical protein
MERGLARLEKKMHRVTACFGFAQGPLSWAWMVSDTFILQAFVRVNYFVL